MPQTMEIRTIYRFQVFFLLSPTHFALAPLLPKLFSLYINSISNIFQKLGLSEHLYAVIFKLILQPSPENIKYKFRFAKKNGQSSATASNFNGSRALHIL